MSPMSIVKLLEGYGALGAHRPRPYRRRASVCSCAAADTPRHGEHASTPVKLPPAGPAAERARAQPDRDRTPSLHTYTAARGEACCRVPIRRCELRSPR